MDELNVDEESKLLHIKIEIEDDVYDRDTIEAVPETACEADIKYDKENDFNGCEESKLPKIKQESDIESLH